MQIDRDLPEQTAYRHEARGDKEIGSDEHEQTMRGHRGMLVESAQKFVDQCVTSTRSEQSDYREMASAVTPMAHRCSTCAIKF
jgi:hypothetical protein